MRSNTCPKCNYSNPAADFDLCPRCGLILDKYVSSQEIKQQFADKLSAERITAEQQLVEWECACGVVNKIHQLTCEGCGWTIDKLKIYLKERDPHRYESLIASELAAKQLLENTTKLRQEEEKFRLDAEKALSIGRATVMTCGNCTYWLRTRKTDGFCRRYPPIPLISGVASASSNHIALGNIKISSYYPETNSDWWCGKWQRISREEEVLGGKRISYINP